MMIATSAELQTYVVPCVSNYKEGFPSVLVLKENTDYFKCLPSFRYVWRSNTSQANVTGVIYI